MFCSKCGTENADDAKFCKSCGTSQVSITSSTSIPVNSSADYEIALLAIPAIGFLLIWFWVSGMNLLQSPSNSLNLIVLATILGTAIVASMEAGKAGMPDKNAPGSSGPLAWFFMFVLVWVVAYPAYLYKRKHFGLSNRMPSGTLIMLIFVGSAYALHSQIEAKRTEIRNDMEKLQTELKSSVSPVQQPDIPIQQQSTPLVSTNENLEPTNRGDNKSGQADERCSYLYKQIYLEFVHDGQCDADPARVKGMATERSYNTIEQEDPRFKMGALDSISKRSCINCTVLLISHTPCELFSATRALRKSSGDGSGQAKAHGRDRPRNVPLHRRESRAG